MNNSEFCMVLNYILGKDDYQWLIDFAEKQRKKEIEEAVNSFQTEKVNKIQAMSTQGYLLYALCDEDFEKKLAQSGISKRDSKRFTAIVAKLRSEKRWQDETFV